MRKGASIRQLHMGDLSEESGRMVTVSIGITEKNGPEGI